MRLFLLLILLFGVLYAIGSGPQVVLTVLAIGAVALLAGWRTGLAAKAIRWDQRRRRREMAADDAFLDRRMSDVTRSFPWWGQQTNGPGSGL